MVRTKLEHDDVWKVDREPYFFFFYLVCYAWGIFKAPRGSTAAASCLPGGHLDSDYSMELEATSFRLGRDLLQGGESYFSPSKK